MDFIIKHDQCFRYWSQVVSVSQKLSLSQFFFLLLGLCDVKEPIYEGLTNQKSVLKGEELKQNFSDREWTEGPH